MGVVKALKKDLGLDEAGPDHLQMFYKLPEKVLAEQSSVRILFRYHKEHAKSDRMKRSDKQAL